MTILQRRVLLHPFPEPLIPLVILVLLELVRLDRTFVVLPHVEHAEEPVVEDSLAGLVIVVVGQF